MTTWDTFVERLEEQPSAVQFSAWLIARECGADDPDAFVVRASVEKLIRLSAAGDSIHSSMYVRGAMLGVRGEPYPLPAEVKS